MLSLRVALHLQVFLSCSAGSPRLVDAEYRTAVSSALNVSFLPPRSMFVLVGQGGQEERWEP